MTVLNHAQSAEAAAVAADTSGWSARRVFGCRLRISMLTTLLITVGVCGVNASADARGVTDGPMGSGGPSVTGRMVAAPTSGTTSRRLSGLHGRSIASMHRFDPREGDIFVDDDFDRFRDFRRFHHHRRDFPGDGFFPFGFFGTWPSAEPDLSAAADDGSDDGDAPSFRNRVERYEPPSVEKTPSGVTIIRGPGSHRF